MSSQTTLPSPAPLIGCTVYRARGGVDATSTLSLFGLRPAYTQAVVAAGGIPVLIPLGLEEADLHAILARVDGLLIPGGGDIEPKQYRGQNEHATIRDVDPDRDRVEFELIQTAVAQEKPLLAICRGHQVFNVALGGSLWEDIASQMPDPIRHDYFKSYPRGHLPHTVTLQPGSRLATQMDRTETSVNSLHHQGIRDLAPGLTAVAHAPDGLIEGIEISDHPYALGVQWHPEDLALADPAMLALFQGLVAAAAAQR